MATLYVTIGLPGSGKTTWARQQITERMAAGKRVARINRDALRDQLHPGAYAGHDTEKAVTLAAHAAMTALLESRWDVICDDTNLRLRNLRALRDLAIAAGAEFTTVDFTDVPLEECIRRDALRPTATDLRDGHSVGEVVIRELHAKFLASGQRPALPDPSPPVPPYLPGPDLPRAVMVDVDGTLALMNGRSPYDESRVHEDHPNGPVVRAVQDDYGCEYRIIVMSGRTEGCRVATEEWLWRNDIPWHELYMRPVGDTRADAVVKMELFNQHIRDRLNVVRVYDDRQQVVDAWRRIMPDRVFQVAPGRF